MNFFFGIKNKEISTKLTIPRFRNREPKKIKLGTWDNKKIADSMAENIKNTVPHRSWKIWVE
jgi:hypothetical protein